jgi:putative transposase
MARLPRLDLPGVAQHVIQRGNNRLPCFLDDADRRDYLVILREALAASGCALHAYALMDNHVHMLVTPTEPGAVGRMMQRLGRRYVAAFNTRHARTGTLWEGRYKACLVGGDRYVLNCLRYIELNPVRARMVADPAGYAWSSCAAHCGGRRDSTLAPHPAYAALGSNESERAAAWRDLLREAVSDEELAEIRRYLQQQRAWGSDRFQARVEAKTRRFAGVRPAHRPPRPKSLGEK